MWYVTSDLGSVVGGACQHADRVDRVGEGERKVQFGKVETLFVFLQGLGRFRNVGEPVGVWRVRC